MVLVFVAPLMVGCLRVHTSITVSDDDAVSGEIDEVPYVESVPEV